jgi:opacity protein-like surface antigen
MENFMIVRGIFVLTVLNALVVTTAVAQSRGEGWEVGAQVIYQDGHDITFEGGSTAELDDDVGLAIVFGYRFNDRLEIQFGLDWSTVDYDAVLVSASGPPRTFSVTGDLEAFTPNVSANFNFLEGPLTPYVTAGVGWAFIDTNIPDAPPQTACWWDPWFGYVCDTWQSTRTSDELIYKVGAGLRWDLSSNHMLRLGYEKQWIDLGTATSTPDFDQLKFGFTFKY